MAHLPRIIIDAALFCPHCGTRHVDESRNGEKWHRRAHTTHRCQSCGKDFDVYVSGAEPEEAKPVERDKLAEDIADALVEVMTDPSTKDADRLRAIEILAERGWGPVTNTAPVAVQVTQPSAGARIQTEFLAKEMWNAYSAAPPKLSAKSGDWTHQPESIQKGWFAAARRAIELLGR